MPSTDRIRSGPALRRPSPQSCNPSENRPPSHAVGTRQKPSTNGDAPVPPDLWSMDLSEERVRVRVMVAGDTDRHVVAG
jgi:hypothetical protein